MKTSLIYMLLVTMCFTCLAQADWQQQAQKNAAEGKLLYKAEMAAWYGSDLFVDKCRNKKEKSGGYIAYTDSNNISKCIYYSKGETPVVLATISFTKEFALHAAKVDTFTRPFTNYENQLYVLRKKTQELINSDTLFKVFRNTNRKITPLLTKNERKVYVTTTPLVTGVVLLGNDYQLTFDNTNQLKEKKVLHKTITQIGYKKDDTEIISTHEHIPGNEEIITATDICTIMQYAKYAGWKQHIVKSEKYVFAWDCIDQELKTYTRKEWDKK